MYTLSPSSPLDEVSSSNSNLIEMHTDVFHTATQMCHFTSLLDANRETSCCTVFRLYRLIDVFGQFVLNRSPYFIHSALVKRKHSLGIDCYLGGFMEGSPDSAWPSPSHWSWTLPAHIGCRSSFPVMYGSFPHIELLINEYLVDHLEQKVLQAASENGAPLHVLEFIITRMTPSWEEVIKAAARGGHVHVFKWILMERRDGGGPWGQTLGNV